MMSTVTLFHICHAADLPFGTWRVARERGERGVLTARYQAVVRPPLQARMLH